MKRVALVTGSSRGIGRGIALQLAQDGWAVAINYLQQKEKAEALVEQLRSEGREAIAVQADVSNRQAVRKMVATVEAELGPVELLVNNAGVAAQMFEALFKSRINIHMISTSEIKISVLIDKCDSEKAIRAIHDQFFD